MYKAHMSLPLTSIQAIQPLIVFDGTPTRT